MSKKRNTEGLVTCKALTLLTVRGVGDIAVGETVVLSQETVDILLALGGAIEVVEDARVEEYIDGTDN